MLMKFGKAHRAMLLGDLGARLKARRLELDLDQNEVMVRVAARASRNGQQIKPLSRTTLSQYETGTTTPALDIIIALADALEITPWWLCFGVELNSSASPPPEPRGESSDAAVRPIYPVYWEAPERADVADAPALALIDAGDHATDAKSGDTLYLFDRTAIPTTTPADFVAVQGEDVAVVRAIKAGEFTLIDQGGDLWRLQQADEVALLGRLVERLEGRSF